MLRSGLAAMAGGVLLLGAGDARGQTLASQAVVTGMSNPLWCGHAPGDASRLFVVEQRRGVRIVDLNAAGTGTLRPTPFLDLTQPALATLLGNNGLEYGILGMAFHPQYASNGYFYIVCTPSQVGSSVNDYAVVRFRVDPANPNFADPNSRQTVIFIDYDIANHRSGWIDFGPEGHLYFTTGDGGEGDPQNTASNRAVLKGKILRLDVDGADNIPGNADDDAFPPATDQKNYSIPADNPFIGQAGMQPEIWAYGLRNAWRASFDRVTGSLWVADVGQVTREEVTVIPAGLHGAFLGWRCMEGTVPTGYAGCVAPLPPSLPPIIDYPRSGATVSGASVTGGVVYRGCSMPSLRGSYIFGDWAAKCWTGTPNAAGTALTNIVDRKAQLGLSGTLVHFGEDPWGEMYYVIWNSTNGGVYRIRPASVAGNDCNSNQQADGCDIAKGVSPDLNLDSVPDDCQGFPCTADFNHDGDTGTDQDIEAFFACIGGTCCPTCSSADFNADGDTGTDQDIESFFRVLGGNAC
ncbi:MAG TPA: PQQ-dependent sugar dehydrogenase [Phycisphaerales bacterium]|nr:PQQ-dependent sugar dehydrogenase [Phycisphaerales bacterium]